MIIYGLELVVVVLATVTGWVFGVVGFTVSGNTTSLVPSLALFPNDQFALPANISLIVSLLFGRGLTDDVLTTAAGLLADVNTDFGLISICGVQRKILAAACGLVENEKGITACEEFELLMQTTFGEDLIGPATVEIIGDKAEALEVDVTAVSDSSSRSLANDLLLYNKKAN